MAAVTHRILPQPLQTFVHLVLSNTRLTETCPAPSRQSCKEDLLMETREHNRSNTKNTENPLSQVFKDHAGKLENIKGVKRLNIE